MLRDLKQGRRSTISRIERGFISPTLKGNVSLPGLAQRLELDEEAQAGSMG